MASKNIKDTNPEAAFWFATAILVVVHKMKMNEVRKNNKQYIIDAIKSRNQSKNKEPNKNSKKYENKEREEDAETRKDIFIKNAI
jgi:hypothetical protein